MKIKLKAVRVVVGVPFDGPTTMTLQRSAGTLEYDADEELIYATPTKSSGISRPIAIPTTNVVYMEILDEERAAKEDEAKKAAPAFAPPPVPLTAKDDTVSLKDELKKKK